ncbi:MAG: hypothetical protein WD883_01450 [Candidatus Colwellbacteria bacterium]
MDQKTPEQFINQLEGLHTEVTQRVESTPIEDAGENAHKQILHQVVGERLGKTEPTAQSATAPISSVPPEVQSRVADLVQKATTHDLDGAIDEARKSGDPLLLDAFHDAVVGELYDHLVSTGKLKALDK